MRRCVYSGSFDCIHNGHVWMVEQGSSLFDEIVVLVSMNANKKHVIDFNDRLRLAKQIFEPIGNNVKVEGLEKEFVVNYATKNGAKYLLRGVRSNLDYEYESQIANINHDLAGDADINSVFLMPPPTLKTMSSSMVRGLIGFNGWERAIEKYVPDIMAKELYYRHSNIANFRINYLLKKYNINYDSNSLIADYNDSSNIHYHNWRHIEECIEQFVRVKKHIQNPDVVEMAIYFHDIVYRPQRADNEELSANFFLNSAMQYYDIEFKQRVSNMIRATKWMGKNTPVAWDNDLEIFHDIDFSIFAATWDRFVEYDDGITKEYSPYAEAKIFKDGRGQFFDGLKRVFKTPYFDEAKAQQNILKIMQERYL